MRPPLRNPTTFRLTFSILAWAAGVGCQDSTPTSVAPESESGAPSYRRGDQTNYELVQLNLGGLEAFATDINSREEVVGGVYRNGSFEAFVYRGGAVRFLGTLGGNYSFANAINDGGDVTGTSTTASGEYHAFIYRPEHGMEDIGVGEGRGINNSEVVVGVSGSTGFRWTATDGMIVLAPLPNDYGSDAVDINDAGVVVGSSVGPTGRHAVLWSAAGNVPQDLGTLGGSSQASGIADNGVIVGTSSTATYMTPFRWTPLTGMTPLADGMAGEAFDVSIAGAVGYMHPFNPPTSVLPTQCFWPPDGPCRPVTTTAATLMGINDRGVIAGAISTSGPYGFAAVVWRPVARTP